MQEGSLPVQSSLRIKKLYRIIRFHFLKSRLNYACFSSEPFSSSVQFSSVAQSCPTLCDPMNRTTPGLPVHHQPPLKLKLMFIESVMPSRHLILCRPLLLLPPIPPSIKVFSNESTLRMRWPKYWSFSFSISPSKEHPGLISFRMGWWFTNELGTPRWS